MDIVIRPAHKDDYPAVARLKEQTQAYHAAILPERLRHTGLMYSARGFAKLLKDCDKIWLAAVDADSHVLGYAYCVRIKKVLWVDDLCVDEACRGQGIGTLLMDAAKKLAVEIGASSLELQVYEANPAALRFYERCGYNRQDKTAFIRWL